MTAEPRPGLGGELEHVSAYLDFYRDTCLAKCRSLPEQELRRPLLPSGWTPLELLWHLAHMERRWFVWGFLGEQVDDPWRDAANGGWITLALPVAGLRTMLDDAAIRTREIVEAHELTERAVVGGRFADEESAPQLQWILLHLIQEYARHTGHLDIARELIDGRTGEDE